jgi:type I restriction enzyme R subunit
LRIFSPHRHYKLPDLLKSKYQTLEDAKEVLGDVNDIVPLFTDFQKYLYQSKVA